jgi:hypothetical protein
MRGQVSLPKPSTIDRAGKLRGRGPGQRRATGSAKLHGVPGGERAKSRAGLGRFTFTRRQRRIPDVRAGTAFAKEN